MRVTTRMETLPTPVAAGVGVAVVTIVSAVVFALVPGGTSTGGTGSAEGPSPLPTYVEPTYDPTDDPEPTYTPEPTEEPTATVPPGYETVDAPGGLTVAIPAGWPVSAPSDINRQADAPDTDCLVRYGGSPSDPEPLEKVVARFETTNPRIRPDYQRMRLEPVSYGVAEEAVDWEFTFRSDTGPRHAYGRYWRLYGTDYVVYASCATGAWPRMGEVVTTLTDTAAPH